MSKIDKTKWYWWEVMFDDRREQPYKGATALEATVESISYEDADQDRNGDPAESTHFIENTVFCVVHTVDDSPYTAVRRAMMQLRPDIVEAREDVRWYNLNC